MSVEVYRQITRLKYALQVAYATCLQLAAAEDCLPAYCVATPTLILSILGPLSCDRFLVTKALNPTQQ